MAESKELNKSEEIRKAGAELKAKGQKISPKAIMEVLGKRGIKVSSPQCSMVLKKAGFKRRKRRTGEAVAKAAPSKSSRKDRPVTIEEVILAKKMADQFGGADRLAVVVRALQRLS